MSLNTTTAPGALLIAALATPLVAAQALAQSPSPQATAVDLGTGIAFGAWRVVYSIGTEDRVLPGDPRTFSVRLTRSLGGPS